VERVQRVDVPRRRGYGVPRVLGLDVSKKPPEGVQQLAELPRKTKYLRTLSNGASLIECSHPEDYRKRVEAGVRAGLIYCGLCRGDDLNRTCITVVYVAEPEQAEPKQPKPKPKPEPEQEALF
jgi:hypothetical protein